MAGTKAIKGETPQAIFGLTFCVVLALSVTAEGNDLRALWLAAGFFHLGPEGVYAGTDGLFRMLPPDLWNEATMAAGLERSVYPYIYPPLWAGLIAPLTEIISFPVFRGIFQIVNAGAVAGMLALAWRITGRHNTTAYLRAGLLIALTSAAFTLPIAEVQPQVLVSALILLAIERERADRPTLAGLALALAAAIKLYPALFALFWLAAGRYRACAAFALFGAALGLMSLWLAGWPMHQAFLAEIAGISNTLLLSFANLSLDPFLATLAMDSASFTRIDTEATGGTHYWYVAEKPGAWRIVNSLALIAGITALATRARKSRLRDPLFWPLALILISWLAPLSWIYHYMTAFFFLPAFFSRFRPRTALGLILLVVLPTTLPVQTLLHIVIGGTAPIQITGNAGLLIAMAAFYFALKRKDLSHPA